MPDITISLTAAQAQRVQAAFASRTGNPSFGVPEYKAWLINQTKTVVLEEERDAIIREAKSLCDETVRTAKDSVAPFVPT